MGAGENPYAPPQAEPKPDELSTTPSGPATHLAVFVALVLAFAVSLLGLHPFGTADANLSYLLWRAGFLGGGAGLVGLLVARTAARRLGSRWPWFLVQAWFVLAVFAYM